MSVASEQIQFNLNTSQLVEDIVYDVVVFAENSVGQGPPSNVIAFHRDKSETGVLIGCELAGQNYRMCNVTLKRAMAMVISAQTGFSDGCFFLGMSTWRAYILLGGKRNADLNNFIKLL